MGTLTVAMLAIAPGASMGKSSAVRVAVDPTPLRLLEPRASDAVSDGERFVVVSLPLSTRRPTEIYDTFTGRRTSLPVGCRVTGSGNQTTTVTAGRALLLCEPSYRYSIIDLESGAIVVELPNAIEAGGTRFADPRYGTLGRRWVRASVDCPELVGCAAAYYDYRTGETRIDRSALSDRLYYDLDAPDLPLRRVCRPAVVYDESVRTYRPPYYVERYVGLRRCSDGRLLQRFSGEDVVADLTAVGLTWGPTGPSWEGRPPPFVNYYMPGPRRLLRWRLPPFRGRSAFGTAVATRCEIFALTSRAFGDRGGGVTSYRIHRARLPAPRDPRCPR